MPDTPDRPADQLHAADQLRAAALKLREEAARAHRASPAPWTVTDEHVVRCADGMTVADRSDTDHPAERADLPYIALMHPGVGLALTDWLESAAERLGDTEAPLAALLDPSALAVARQLLGTTSQDTADPEVVAYRNTDRPGVLLCREHGEGWLGLTPLTSEDLPDGGFCTWGREYGHGCGRDVLITPTVPPAPADRAATCICGHPEQQHFEDACQTCDCGDYIEPQDAREVIARWRQEALSKRDLRRAATLREAADIAEELRQFDPAYGARKAAQISENVGLLRVADALRRLAGEAAAGAHRTEQAQPDDIQVWPLARVLAEVRCGSQDWTWDEEWADLDKRHAETGYLDRLEQEITANGITMPVLIGSDGRLWDGHHRLRIAVRLGIGYVPVEITPPAVPAAPEVSR
ncbi:MULTISPECIES: ParB N-terminal domain-containing protein [unclassified Streptomyces]|uniref:ParB N-terminal domain-containing protein n=1 Tax=unclassified Streptomyces TaxID=2593676 RepID=UPI000BF0B8EE|nr:MULTISPECIES: ParB N-terminal domain-containing protein [unclassified Streptomyces]